jgi:hypothetical protein
MERGAPGVLQGISGISPSEIAGQGNGCIRLEDCLKILLPVMPFFPYQPKPAKLAGFFL